MFEDREDNYSGRARDSMAAAIATREMMVVLVKALEASGALKPGQFTLAMVKAMAAMARRDGWDDTDRRARDIMHEVFDATYQEVPK